MVANTLIVALRRSSSIAGLSALVALAAACDKMPLVAPSGTVITLTSTTNFLPVNGSTDITALLIENGQAPTTAPGSGTTAAGTPVHNGTLVTFTTTLGRIEPAEARTTAGRAIVKLIATGQSGVATVTAFSGGASRIMAINVGAAAAARILVTASPQALPATGGTATVSARVEDGQGNGLQGIPVSFSTTAGTLAGSTALTNELGIASTTLTTTAAATVTASAGGGSSATGSTLTGTVVVTLSPNIALGLSPQAGVITVSTTMTFSVTVGATPVLTDVKINFGDGESFDLGALSQAQTVPHMYGSTGAFLATATAVAADGTSKTVNAPVIVTDWQVNLASSGNTAFGGTSTFTATVVPAGVSVSAYVWDFGDEGSVTTSSNVITHVFQSRGTKTVKVTAVPTKGGSKFALASLEIN